MKKKVIFLGINEVNFPFIEKYIEQGHLPNFARLFKKHGYSETTSEKEYDLLEPWIQWVTVQTGLTYEEHKVFRLGDITKSNHEQIWEKLEKKGYTVGAVSPINAANNTQDACFFVPDPWTPTKVTGDWFIRLLHKSIVQLVNDNAQSKVTVASALGLLIGAAKGAQAKNIPYILSLGARIKNKPWNKALILDRLLSDVFHKLWKKHQPDFSTLFLNAGAHIQHHYMHSSAVYDGPCKNPEWYINSKYDPILEVYELYDSILGEYLSLPVHLIISTGLHQDPYEESAYYYRLKEHAKFLNKVGIKFKTVTALMSRDFTIDFNNPEETNAAEITLNSIKSIDNKSIFYVDNRGTSLFVMLTYPNEIRDNFTLILEGKKISNFEKDVAFVAIKNGHHNGIGYIASTNTKYKASIPLPEVFNELEKCLEA